MVAHNCHHARASNTRKMFKTIDLYLGVFLVLCGFGISLLNLRSLMSSKTKYTSVLLSENILIMCIGISFLCRAVYALNPVNMELGEVELRTAGINPNLSNISSTCGFSSLLLSYGPLVVSLVNSFLSLIIDNYMHYRMLTDIKKKDEQDLVREIGESSGNSRSDRKIKFSRLHMIWRKYFSLLTIGLQWIVPLLIASFMYPMGVKEMPVAETRNIEDSCMAMLDINSIDCLTNFNQSNWINDTDLRKYIPAPLNYLEVIEKENPDTNSSQKIDSILNNVLNILKNFNNHSDFEFTNVTKSPRRPKINDKCTKICFTENKSMLVYMFVLALISYFVPITISTVILTKIHFMEVNRPNAKTYVTRELLYNILFWSPVMFDTFLSLIMCSYSMHGTRTSFFNVVANVYQAVKNFMNTRYFKENAIVPT